MAVFDKTKNTPPYVAAKRLLEDALWRSKNWRNTRILRFGTVCGPGHPSTHRVHLLLNKMVHDALTEKVITVNGPCLERPVLGIKGAIKAICEAVDGRPGGTVSNHYWCSGTLMQYARAVQRVLEFEVCHSPQICLKNPVDKRSYGWDSFGIENAIRIIYELVRFYSKHQEFPDYYGELRERFGV